MHPRLHSLIVDLHGEELVYQYMCREGDAVPPLATFRKVVRISQLKNLSEGLSRTFESFRGIAASISALPEWGGKLYDRLLPSELVERLTADSAASPMALYLDPEIVWVPWELLWDGAEFFSGRFRIGRLLQKTAGELRAAERRMHEPRSGRGALVVFGDTSGLQAHAEKTEVESALGSVYGSNIWFHSTRSAADVLEQLKQDYEVCHFVGHGKYVGERPDESGWAFADGSVLTCADIEGVSSRAVFPLLVFANSCDSAHGAFAEREGYVSALYRAFLRQGVPHYVGTIAPIPDEPSKRFAGAFYRMLAEGAAIGEALADAKQLLARSIGMPIWPYYVHYGDPTYRFTPAFTTRSIRARGERGGHSVLGRLGKDEIQRMLEHYKNAVATRSDDGEAFFGLGLCYLQLGLHDLSIRNLKRAVELMPEYADAYYYCGLSLIRGRRLKTLTLNEVRLIEQYLATALQLDDRQAKYYYLAAILKFGYYLSNGLLVRPPSFGDLLDMAESREHDPWEVERLLQLVSLQDTAIISRIRKSPETSGV